MTTPRQWEELLLNKRSVNSIWLSPSGSTLAYGGRDNKVTVRNLDVGTMFEISLGSEIEAVCGGKNWVATSTRDKRLRVHSAQDGDLLHDFFGRGRVKTLWPSSDGSVLAVGGWDKVVKVYDITTGERTHSIRHEARVNAVCGAKKGKMIAVGAGNAVFIYTLSSEPQSPNTPDSDDLLDIEDSGRWEVVHEIETRSDVTALWLSENGITIALGLEDGLSQVLELRDEGVEQLYQFQLQGRVNSLWVTNDCGTMATAGQHPSVVLHDLKAGKVLHELPQEAEVKSISGVDVQLRHSESADVHSGGSSRSSVPAMLAVGGVDCVVSINNLATSEVQYEFEVQAEKDNAFVAKMSARSTAVDGLAGWDDDRLLRPRS